MTWEDPKGSFTRWQSVTIGQLTYAINLILGFSVATLGFQVTLLLNEKFVPVSHGKCVFSLSLLLLGLSVLFGIAVVINRLRDFRATMKAARLREQGATPESIEDQRILYRRLGARTWCLFWWQVGTFSFGILLVVLSVLASSAHKLL